MKKLIALLAVAGILSGCTNLKLQWSASYQTDNLMADLQLLRDEKKAEQQVELDKAAAARAGAMADMMLAK